MFKLLMKRWCRNQFLEDKKTIFVSQGITSGMLCIWLKSFRSLKFIYRMSRKKSYITLFFYMCAMTHWSFEILIGSCPSQRMREYRILSILSLHIKPNVKKMRLMQSIWVSFKKAFKLNMVSFLIESPWDQWWKECINLNVIKREWTFEWIAAHQSILNF